MTFRVWSFLRAIKKLLIICVVRENRSYICHWRYTIWGTTGNQAERNGKKKQQQICSSKAFLDLGDMLRH